MARGSRGVHPHSLADVEYDVPMSRRGPPLIKSQRSIEVGKGVDHWPDEILFRTDDRVLHPYKLLAQYGLANTNFPKHRIPWYQYMLSCAIWYNHLMKLHFMSSHWSLGIGSWSGVIASGSLRCSVYALYFTTSMDKEIRPSRVSRQFFSILRFIARVTWFLQRTSSVG